MNMAQCEMFAIDRAQPEVYDPNYFDRVNGSWTKSPHPIERYCRQLGSNTLGNHCAMCPAEVDEASQGGRRMSIAAPLISIVGRYVWYLFLSYAGMVTYQSVVARRSNPTVDSDTLRAARANHRER